MQIQIRRPVVQNPAIEIDLEHRVRQRVEGGVQLVARLEQFEFALFAFGDVGRDAVYADDASVLIDQRLLDRPVITCFAGCLEQVELLPCHAASCRHYLAVVAPQAVCHFEVEEVFVGLAGDLLRGAAKEFADLPVHVGVPACKILGVDAGFKLVENGAKLPRIHAGSADRKGAGRCHGTESSSIVEPMWNALSVRSGTS